MVGIAGPGEGRPGRAHLPCQRQGFRGAAAVLVAELGVIHHEGDFRTVKDPRAVVELGRPPRIHVGIRGSGAEGRLARRLGEGPLPDGPDRDGRIEAKGRSLRIIPAVGGDDPRGPVAVSGPDPLAQLRLSQRVDLGIVHAVHEFMEIAAGDQRDVGRDRQGRGLERVVRQERAVHRRHPGNRLEVPADDPLGRRAELPQRRRGGAGQAADRKLLQLVQLTLAQSQFGQHRGGQPGRRVRRAKMKIGAALDHRAVKQALGPRHSHQRRDLPASARLAENHDPARIAAKVGDVVADPLQDGDQVQQPRVGGTRVFFTAELRQVQVAEDVQAVVVVDHDDVLVPGQVLALVGEQVLAAAPGKAAAVHEDHHRPPAGAVDLRRPEIHPQAILPRDLLGRAAVQQECVLILVGPVPAVGDHVRGIPAGAGPAVVQRVADAGPGLGLRGRHEPARAARRSPIGHALEAVDATAAVAAHFARGGRHHRRGVGRDHPVRPIRQGRRGGSGGRIGAGGAGQDGCRGEAGPEGREVLDEGAAVERRGSG